MSDQHTQGKLQAGVSIFQGREVFFNWVEFHQIKTAGVSIFQGREVFTAVPTDNVQKIVALFGFCGADDEAESIANLLRFVACWNKFHGTSTMTIESMTKPVHEVLFDAGARMHAAEAQRDELLKALKNFVNHGTCFDEDDMAQALAAIAKAEGGAV